MPDLTGSLDTLLNVAKTAAGIGGLIFVHELGHFLVGRWCGVRAETFSIGFGKAFLTWKPGVTEYRLSTLPLGGYVKFLQENPDEGGEPLPDSFMAATYSRKVAILSAGVVMNVITAFFLFIGAYSIGVVSEAPVCGQVREGSPAWEAGLLPGDEVVTIDGDRILDFRDIVQATILSDDLTLVVRRDGKELPPIDAHTEKGADGRRSLGIGVAFGSEILVAPEGTAFAAGFRDGDRPVSVDGKPTSNLREAMEAHQATRQSEATTWVVERDGEQVTLNLPVERPQLLGAMLDAASIGAVRRGGPAAAAGLGKGDEPVRVGGRSTPTFLAARTAVADASLAGPLVVRRDGAEVEIPLPGDAAQRAAFAASFASETRSDGPALVFPSVERESALTKAGIEPGSVILSLDGKPTPTFADIPERVAALKQAGRNTMSVTWRDAQGAEHEGELTLVDGPADVEELGLGATVLETRIQETNVLAAAGLGVERTQRWVQRIFSTLGSIVTGGISPRELSGPIQIVRISYRTARSGLAEFLLFLGMISVNLAVLNILPIPMLDGGQIMVLTAEKVYGKQLPVVWLERIQMVGLVMLLGLMVFAIGNDLVKLIL